MEQAIPMTAYDDFLNAPRSFIEGLVADRDVIIAAQATQIANLEAALGVENAQLAADLAQALADLATRTSERDYAVTTLATETTRANDAETELADTQAALDTTTIALADATTALNEANVQVEDLQADLAESQAWGLEQQQAAADADAAWQASVDAFNLHMSTVHSVQPTPTVPTGLTVTAGDGSVDLNWNEVTGDGFKVYRSPTASGPWTLAGTATLSHSTVSGLTNGSTYWFGVTNLLGTVESAKSNLVSATPVHVTPPPVGATVFGASDGDWPIVGITKLNGHRAYLGGGDLGSGTSWTSTGELSSALARVNNGGTVWLSIKDNKATDLARVIQQFWTVTAGRNLDLVVTYRHEPENDVKKALSDSSKQADIASYQAAWANLKNVIKNNGAKSATCLLGDRVSPMIPNNAESVAYHVVGVDYVGFDRYNPGLGNATNYVNAHTVLGGCVQYVTNRGNEDGRDYALAIGEWGTIAVGSDSNGNGGNQAGRRTWAADYVTEIEAIHADPNRPDVPVCLYWNQSRMAFDTDPNHQLGPIALNL